MGAESPAAGASLGNDVVDLDDPPNRVVHPRYAARVCGPEEAARVHKSPEPRAALWTLFAAKEAAYKAAMKLPGGPSLFEPRRYFVEPDLRSVRLDRRHFSLRVETHASWIHAVAWTGPVCPHAALQAVPDVSDPGAEARLLLRRELSRGLACPLQCLDVVRPPRPGSWDGFGPPRLYVRGEPAPVDVSLSHDGRFVACAFLRTDGRD